MLRHNSLWKKDTRPILNASIILFAIRKLQESQHPLCKSAATILTTGLTPQIHEITIDITTIEDDLTLLEAFASQGKNI